MGAGACVIGGVGSIACDDCGGVTGPSIGAGAASIDWRDWHVEKILPIAFCAVIRGGLAGGEAKRDACSRVRGACDDECDWCDESQEKADGSSMAMVARGVKWVVPNVVYSLRYSDVPSRVSW